MILLVRSFATTGSWPSLPSIGKMPWHASVAGSIGALQMLVALTVGQAISSVVLEQQDWVFYPQHAITAPRAIGVVAVAVAVAAGRILVRL